MKEEQKRDPSAAYCVACGIPRWKTGGLRTGGGKGASGGGGKKGLDNRKRKSPKVPGLTFMRKHRGGAMVVESEKDRKCATK